MGVFLSVKQNRTYLKQYSMRKRTVSRGMRGIIGEMAPSFGSFPFEKLKAIGTNRFADCLAFSFFVRRAIHQVECFKSFFIIIFVSCSSKCEIKLSGELFIKLGSLTRLAALLPVIGHPTHESFGHVAKLGPIFAQIFH